MAKMIVSSGQSSSGITLTSGDTLDVLAGGSATKITAGPGAVIDVAGSTRSDTISGGGADDGLGNFTATTLQQGGTVDLTTLVYGTGHTYSFNDTTDVLTISNVPSGDTTTVTFAGTYTGEYFHLANDGSGGTAITLTNSATTSGPIVVSGETFIRSGETSSGFAVVDGGTLTVLSGGVALAVAISNGGMEVISGGSASGATITVGGQEIVDSGMTAAATVLSGGLLQIGAAADYDGVSSAVLSGAIVMGGTIDAFYGVLSGVVLSGGQLDLVGGLGGPETAFNTIIGSGGVEQIGEDNTESGATVRNGGLLEITTSQRGGGIGQAISTTVMSGGTMAVVSGDQPAPGNYTFAPTASTILQAGGTLDLTNMPYSSGLDYSFDSATDLLTISKYAHDGGVQFAGTYTGDYFHLVADGTGGTAITLDGTPCYCRGTQILTDIGEVAVEDLQIGDRLVTLGGTARPIRWIGRRAYEGRFAAGNIDVLPITFRIGSLGNGLPKRDLHVSPLHAMYLEDVLVPAKFLVNGTSVVQAASVLMVEYFHVELETHDVIFAEGAPAETYLDDANRGMFHNAAEHTALYPGHVRPEPVYCAERLEHGFQLETIRRGIAAAPQAVNQIIAPHPTARAPAAPAPLRGNLDHANLHEVVGWAYAPPGPLALQIVVDGSVISTVLAESWRPDLAAAQIGDGRHGFTFHFPIELSPRRQHVIEVRRQDDRAPLPGSPFLLLGARKIG